ncbi:MAG TPA: endonuclease/exonuclease/phosphatase family protein [Tepidisphaeraceae bacterium]|nr:endonuclease/exonuclease/phosphatase family protein [Tepidisphaeraceae bacterium]
MALRTALLLVLVTAASSAPAADAPAPSNATGVRVMSFNIRYSTAPDKEDRWEKRQDFLIDTIRAYNPDLLGTQEVLADQADFLQQRLPEYGFVGGGRDDGKRKGEYSPIQFKKDRFELLAHGQWWLSPTPEKVGSKGWDAALPRIVTWARLKDRQSGKTVVYFNTHWDHMGKTARVESGKLMRKLVDDLVGGEDVPVVVTGDFNSTEDTEQYRSLTVGDGTGMKLIDAYRTVHPEKKPDEASFNGFKGTTKGLRIDWVLHSPHWVAKGAAIDRTTREGRTPSDHYPVTAELELKK